LSSMLPSVCKINCWDRRNLYWLLSAGPKTTDFICKEGSSADPVTLRNGSNSRWLIPKMAPKMLSKF
jgi:hypothetical protein